MIKVKIFKTRRFKYSDSPISYEFIMKNAKEKISGDVIVDFQTETVKVNFERKLSYYEKLAILKEVFYRFCITSTKMLTETVEENIEEFQFIDLKSDKKGKSILEEALEYPQKDYSESKKKERALASIIVSYNEIVKRRKEGYKKIELQPLYDLGYEEAGAYYYILKRFLKTKGFKGVLCECSNIVEFYNPYLYTYPHYRVFRYEEN